MTAHAEVKGKRMTSDLVDYLAQAVVEGRKNLLPMSNKDAIDSFIKLILGKSNRKEKHWEIILHLS